MYIEDSHCLTTPLSQLLPSILFRGVRISWWGVGERHSLIIIHMNGTATNHGQKQICKNWIQQSLTGCLDLWLTHQNTNNVNLVEVGTYRNKSSKFKASVKDWEPPQRFPLRLAVRNVNFAKDLSTKALILSQTNFLNYSFAFQSPIAAKTWMRSMTALSSELASLSASSQVPHFFFHKLRWNSSIKTAWKLAERPLLVYMLSYRNALCVREESSPHGQVCVVLFSYFSSKLSETSITEVNLPHWHLWRSFSPSLGFLLLMRAMEGEGKPNNSGAIWI